MYNFSFLPGKTSKRLHFQQELEGETILCQPASFIPLRTIMDAFVSVGTNMDQCPDKGLFPSLLLTSEVFPHKLSFPSFTLSAFSKPFSLQRVKPRQFSRVSLGPTHGYEMVIYKSKHRKPSEGSTIKYYVKEHWPEKLAPRAHAPSQCDSLWAWRAMNRKPKWFQEFESGIEFSRKRWNHWVIWYAEQSPEPFLFHRYSSFFFSHPFFIPLLCLWRYSFSLGFFPAPFLAYPGSLGIRDSIDNFKVAVYSCFFLKWDLFCH